MRSTTERWFSVPGSEYFCMPLISRSGRDQLQELVIIAAEETETRCNSLAWVQLCCTSQLKRILWFDGGHRL